VNRDRAELGPKDVVNANIAFHNALADTYDEEQPHFRPENKALVLERLKYYAKNVGNQMLLDLGCGTGFIIHLAAPLYESIYGVDVTAAMLARVDTSSGKVKLFETNSETIPLDSGVADVVTANSFLHHLYDIRPTLSEAFRILKKGGVFYSEEDPNFHFWQALRELPASGSSILQREIESVQKTDEIVEGTKGVDVETVRMAEYQKMVLGGIRPEKLRELLEDIGFSSINIQHYWFLGEGLVLHGKSISAAQIIGDYLRSIIPLSSHLFKYLRVEAYK
jgi:ubiquinone/menaquinone biosynthesis C-methylase UbiE